jgi:phosphoribosylanthranilate isomerase
VRVKVCGVTRPEDAELAIELGAWALGFIFYERSPRRCDAAVTAGVAARYRRAAEMVGVFVDPSLDEVARAVDGVSLTAVQLHGHVGPQFCEAVHERTGAKVIRAFEVRSGQDVQDARRFRIGVDFHLFDTRVVGGSGETWDWSLARGRRSRIPLILSGGLTPDNVSEGVAAVRPYAVDTASGTEAEPGVKDPDKLRAFFEAVNVAVV